jgi:hypothetical protein
VYITYPDDVKDPENQPQVPHELIHATTLEQWWGPFLIPLFAILLPLPIVFSGRWFIERRAYLEDIKSGVETVDSAVYNLWNYYLMCWPTSLMRKWFNNELEGE